MAGIAVSGGGNMRGILARGGGAIVAAGAIVGNTRVIKACRRPLGGGMATVAGGCRRYVIGGLSIGVAAVVTLLALALHLRMFNAVDGCPAEGGMTLTAIVTAWDVVGRFAPPGYKIAAAVAGKAFTGGAFEQAFYMAGFAFHQPVKSFQRKSCTIMIKSCAPTG